jgi:hypothetical protein
MRKLLALNIFIQTLLIVFVIYIYLFIFNINWDFILAIFGVFALNGWQIIRLGLGLKTIKKIPAYNIAIIVYSLLLLTFIITFKVANYKLLISTALVVALYTFCIDAYYFFYKKLQKYTP